MSSSECFWNGITAAIAPELFEAGSTAISEVYGKTRTPPKSVPVSDWPSIFSGLEVIVNRTTSGKLVLALLDLNGSKCK
jgi:hypothetical protein